MISIRPLTANDVDIYRRLRRTVLLLGDGRYFADSYTREAALDEQGWRTWCTETDAHCILGIFDKTNLVGVLMITRHGDPFERCVEWEAIWLHPSYRRKGIARRAYETAEAWTAARGYRRVALYIRADNLRSQQIHTRCGAIHTGIKPAEIWADGSVADIYCYSIYVADFGQQDTPDAMPLTA
jgi:RimJ/RimL family protein N-acetyltransferase